MYENIQATPSAGERQVANWLVGFVVFQRSLNEISLPFTFINWKLF
jgi:hypothetical protein